MSDGMTVIEINGVKMEVDLRTARKVEAYKVGDNVKVLLKTYSDSYASYPGVIVGFDDFKQLPTIVICYINTGYDGGVKFVYLNTASKDVEICHMGDGEKMIDRGTATAYLDREIAKKQSELADLLARKAYFIANYDLHFGDKVAQPEKGSL
jgi:hypothetical protein